MGTYVCLSFLLDPGVCVTQRPLECAYMQIKHYYKNMVCGYECVKINIHNCLDQNENIPADFCWCCDH